MLPNVLKKSLVASVPTTVFLQGIKISSYQNDQLQRTSNYTLTCLSALITVDINPFFLFNGLDVQHNLQPRTYLVTSSSIFGQKIYHHRLTKVLPITKKFASLKVCAFLIHCILPPIFWHANQCSLIYQTV